MGAGGLTSSMFLVDSALVNALWWKTFAGFEANPGKASCRRFFLGSLVHLLAMLGLFVLHARGVRDPCSMLSDPCSMFRSSSSSSSSGDDENKAGRLRETQEERIEPM